MHDPTGALTGAAQSAAAASATAQNIKPTFLSIAKLLGPNLEVGGQGVSYMYHTFFSGHILLLYKLKTYF